MLMFYKEDGSYDVKAFYEHRLIDEYQEGYGVGEDVGQANGIKIGKKQGISIGEARGRIIGLNEGRNLAIKSLSQNGMSNETIANGLNIPLEKVEEILNQKGLKLKRVH